MANVSAEKNKNLRKNLVKYLNDLDSINTKLTEFKLFGHYNNLRLSENGNIIMKNIFNTYIFPLNYTLTIKDKVTLSQNMNSFYYLTDKAIVIYDEQEAFNINLIGDIKTWISSISIK